MTSDGLPLDICDPEPGVEPRKRERGPPGDTGRTVTQVREALWVALVLGNGNAANEHEEKIRACEPRVSLLEGVVHRPVTFA